MVDVLIGFLVGQPTGEQQTKARTDGGDGCDGDQESGGGEDEQEGGENKESEDANNRRNRSSSRKGARPRKHCGCIFQNRKLLT